MDNSEKSFPRRISRDIFQLSNTVYYIKSKFLAHMYGLPNYCILMVSEEPFGLLLFDTGGPGTGEIIYNSIKSLGFGPADLKGVAISHWHKDHTGGLAGLVKLLPLDSKPLKIYVGQKDLPLWLNRHIRPLWAHPILHIPIPHQAGKLPPMDRVQFVPLNPYSEENPLDEWGIEFIPTPGHTPGHTSYFHKPSAALFPGCGLSTIAKNTVGIVPMFWRRKIKVESARKLAKFDFKYLYPIHFIMEAGQIPLEKRKPVKKTSHLLLRVLGCYPVFKYSKV